MEHAHEPTRCETKAAQAEREALAANGITGPDADTIMTTARRPRYRYWAGGSAFGWFVKRRVEPVFCGDSVTHELIEEFPSSAYDNGETGAAAAANAVAELLNGAAQPTQAGVER